MTVPRSSFGNRFRPGCLFQPRQIAVLGAGGAQGGRVMRNLMTCGFGGAVLPVQQGVAAVAGVLAYADVAGLPVTPDLALLCDGGGEPETVMPALAACGTFACIVMRTAPALPGELRRLAEISGVRSLGPRSFGLAVPGMGLNASLAHLAPAKGRLALVSQSSALCRTVIDWAAPIGLGFSHIVGVGANDDIGYGMVLDWLSRDVATGAILLDLRRLKDARMFLSAARAAARLRPVVAIWAGGRLADPSGATDATLAAALQRVGVLCVDRLEDLLGAAETLARVKPARGETLAIVSNATGPARMAADAAVREGVKLAAPQPSYAALADLAAESAKTTQAGGVLIVHAPEGDDDKAMAEVVAAARGAGLPWLVCALGEATGAERRRMFNAAGVPAFAEPGAAVRAFAYLVQDRRNRAAARELPAADMLAVRPDRAVVAAALGRGDLANVFAQYGLPLPAGPTGTVAIEVSADPLFGPVISMRPAASESWRDRSVDLPPLNLPLAHAMVARAAFLRRADPAVADLLAGLLVRVSALLVDNPAVASLRFDPFAPAQAQLKLHSPGTRLPRMALPPYPSGLIGRFDAAGEALTIRPIRPEDAEAHKSFFARLTPEDVRRRFFSSLRELPPEQMVRMTQIDYEREMAFVAVREAAGETVGVARLVRETLLNEGEFAVIVQPDMKGKGLASHLMHRLIAWARAQGLDAIVGEVLAENHPMRAFVLHLGFSVHAVSGDPDLVEARLDLRQPA